MLQIKILIEQKRGATLLLIIRASKRMVPTKVLEGSSYTKAMNLYQERLYASFTIIARCQVLGKNKTIMLYAFIKYSLYCFGE